MAVCPTCGKQVAEKKAPGAGRGPITSTHRDKTYYLCNKVCLKKFEESPEKFINK